MIRITRSILVVASFTLALGTWAGAQTSSPASPAASPASPVPEQPLGDYARKVHKDANPAKPKAKVFDNDNLPTDEKLSVVGPAPTEAANAAPGGGGSATGSKDAGKPAGSDDEAKKQEEWKGWHDKVSSQKEQIDLASRELDVLQREYQLRAAEMYADAGNRLRNSGQWDKQDADYKQKIAGKQKAVDDAKQKLDDLQEQGRRAGVPSSMLD
jgi:hypothetical protein